MAVYYKDIRIISGKPKWVIVDEEDTIVSRNPSKEELSTLDEMPYIKYKGKRKIKNYTREELLNYLVRFEKENGRPPTYNDLTYDRRYPGANPYIREFGTLEIAKKLVGQDIDRIVSSGMLKTNIQRGRWFEIWVNEQFEGASKDLSGDDRSSPYDGECPKGQKYDAKSSKLHHYGKRLYWSFPLTNSCREEIKWFYLGAFDEDLKALLHIWRIPGDFTRGDIIHIGVYNTYKYNIENMRKYEITDNFLKEQRLV